MYPPHIFAENPIDRAAIARRDEGWVRAQREDARGLYLPLRRLEPAVVRHSAPHLAWLPRADALGLPLLAEHREPLLLGVLDGVPRFAVAVQDGTELSGAEFGESRVLGPELPPGEAGMLAQARSIVDWHWRHRFCGLCGAPTVAVEGGARRHCPSCNARHYPQVSPSMIVVVAQGDRCLLARRPRAPQQRYSCLAGFVEIGESIEEAVAREVYEECGVHVGDVTYHSSQPWPFPATLMIGCIAEATSTEIRIDPEEIEEAGWFDRAQVRDALDRRPGANLVLPDRVAIAHHIIRAWAFDEVAR